MTNIFVGREISTELVEISVVEISWVQISRTENSSSKKFHETIFSDSNSKFRYRKILATITLYLVSEISIKSVEISMVKISGFEKILKSLSKISIEEDVSEYL